MRTLLSGELTQALSYDSDYYGKLEVQNGSGTWIDLNSLFPCIINATWVEHVNDPVSKATFTVVRNVQTNSLAPFMEGSPLNVDDADDYAPLLEQGRGIRFSTATMAEGVSLDTSKYRQVFIGRIDRVKQTRVDGGATPIVLECSDLGAWLMDMQIHDGTTKYGDTDGGDPLETVIQDILDDKIPAGEPSVTLVKSSSSNFAVTSFDVEEKKVLEVLTSLVLDSVGEDLRYRYDSSHVSQFTWFDPDRSRSSVDATITGYYLRKLETAIDDIRNSGELPYIDAATGVSGTVTSEDTASIAKYRERFQRMAQSPLLTDSTSALATIDAVISDLSGPLAEFEASCPYLWFVQLFDRYTFPADGETYDTDQTFGVVGYQHTIKNGRGETVIQCAGRIVGAYAEWLKRIPDNSTVPKLDVEVPPLLSYQVRVDDSDPEASVSYLTAKVQGGPGTYVTRALARIDREPTEAELDAATASPSGQRSGVFVDIAELEAGKRFYVAGRAYDREGNGTAIARISEVWLGLDSTPGADVTIGTIVSQTDKIIFPIAFDNECAYCEVWSREFTSNPGSLYSLENTTQSPYRVLTLGVDAMVPGVEFELEIPIAATDNWLMVTFVPFDHLGKRGNLKTRKAQGDQGVIGGGGGTDPITILGADLVFWWDPTQETAYGDDDEVVTATDWSGNGNDGTADNSNQDFYASFGNVTWSENEQNGLPMFIFNADASSTNILRQWLICPDLGFAPADDGAFLFVVAKRHVIHRQFQLLAHFCDNADTFPLTGAGNSHLGETDGSEGAGTEDEIKWAIVEGGGAAVYSGSLTTEIAAYGVRIDSATSGIMYVDGVIDPNGPFDPASDVETKEAIRIGEGNFKVGDVVYARGIPTAEQIAALFDWANAKWVTGPGGGGAGTPPDPPANVEQISATGETVTVRVTMPTTAPDYIRITVGNNFSYDEAVSVSGGATQDFVVENLKPSTSYQTYWQSVDSSLVSSGLGLIITTTGDGGTLSDPVINSVTYTPGDQNIVIAIAASSNPRGTQFIAQSSTNPLGPFTGTTVGYDFGSGVTILIPYAQTSVSTTVYVRVFARKAGWTDSGFDTDSVIVPGRNPLGPGTPT